MILSNEELHIILKRRKLEICEDSELSLIIDKIIFYIHNVVPKFYN